MSWLLDKLKFPTQDFKKVGSFLTDKYQKSARDYETKFRQPAKKEVSKYLVGKPISPDDVGRFIGGGVSSILDRLKPPTRDIKTIGRAVMPPVKDFKRTGGWLLDKLRPPTRDFKTVGKTAFGLIPKIGETVGEGITSLAFGDVRQTGIEGIPKHIWDIEKSILEIAPKFGFSTHQAFKPKGTLLTGKTEEKPYTLPSSKITERLGFKKEYSTYQKEFEKTADEIIDGKKPLWHALIPFAEVPFDGMIVSSFLTSGAKSIFKKVKVNSNETAGAIKAMGLKDISVKAQKTQYRKLAHELHPDKVGVQSDKLFKELNNANNILNKARSQGLLVKEPSKIALAMKGIAETGLRKPSEIGKTFAKRETPYLGVKGLLPEQAGTIPTQPFQARQRAMGLSIRDIKAKPIKSSDKYLETMRRPKEVEKIDRKVNDLVENYAKGEEKIKKLEVNLLNEIPEKERLSWEKLIEAEEVGNRSVIKQISNKLKISDYETIEALSTYIDAGKKRGGRTLKDFYDWLPKKQVVKPTPKADPLITEARKYKSAEDFVKAKQKDIVYHGSNQPLEKFDKRGAFFTDDMMNAEGYAGGENVYEGYLNLKNPLVIDAKGRHYSDLKTPYGKSTQEIVGKVDDKKYDGVIFKNINDSFADDVDIVGTDTIFYPFNANKSFINESQLTDIYNKAKTLPEAKKPPVVKIKAEEGVKLLTTSDIAGEGFVMKGLPKRYGLLPATRMQRELETARRIRIEKKVTDPLLHRLDKTNTRKGQIRIVRDYFGLTDTEIKSISRKDVGLMSDFEFKNFIDDVRVKADKIGKKNQAMNELVQQTMDKELDVENMRKAMKLPTMKNMTITDIKKLDEAIRPFQKGDEFLSVRKLEVVDRTELKGIKTWREAREKLAKKLDVPVEELQNIKVSEFDRFRYDTALAERNPFYKMMVEESAGKMLVSEAEYLKLEQKVFTLAKGLKPKGITGRIIPQQKNIRAFMEAKPEDRSGIILNETEDKLVRLMTNEFEDVRSYLIRMEAMKMGKENYFTHIRRGILEAVKEDGIVKATKEVFTQYKLEEQAFNILDRQTGEILAMDKFFKFAMHRTGGIKPTENTVKAFLTYMRTFKKKQALDEIVPLVDIYAQALTPKGMTKKGVLLHGNLQTFVKEWLNTKKGRHITLMAKQNGKIDGALRTIKMFTSLRDLGLNIPVSVASEVGEQVTTYQLLGKGRFALGKIRQNTKQGKVIIEKYRNLIGKNPWRELVEPSKEAGDRLMEGIFILFRDASTRSNKTFLLGSLSKQEFKTGIITPERLSALRTELGRYRMVQGMKSIIGATPEGGAYTQYKTWAIPILRTNVKNLEIIGKKLAGQSKGSSAWKKSILEFYREVEITAFAMLAFSLVRDEDDNSFVGQIINKMYRESTTLIQALQPKMFLTAGRTASFITELGENLTSILLWEEYKTKEGLKGVERLKKQLTPVVLSQFLKTKEEKTPYEKAVSEDKEKDKKEREALQPKFDKIDRTQSEELLNALTEREYKIYKKRQSAEKTKDTNKKKEEFYPTFKKIRDVGEKDEAEAMKIINSLTDEEYRIYELLRNQLD